MTGSYVTHVGIYVDFNPHHREGGDNAHHIKLHYQKISIHTTAKVVTNETDGADSNAFISIHTTAKVVTKRKSNTGIRCKDFNPHHREGGD